MLNNLLESKERLEVRIVLDGIDELYPEDLGRFLSNLREVWKNVEGKLNITSKLKVLIVSRPLPNISEILKDLPFINPEKESTDCLNSLSSMADNQRREIISLGSKKTGAWLWEDDAYKLWSKETKSALLWIQGKPGSGKSTLCKKILKHLQTQHDLPDTYATPNKATFHNIAPQPRHRSVVLASFFYSLRGAKSEISNTHMLQSLLHQLLGQEQRLYPAFRTRYRNLLDRSQSPISWTFKDLHSVFTSLGEFDDFPLTIYLIIDAMDESEQSERSDILLLLKKFCRNESACVIKCVLASRPEEDIKNSFYDIQKSQDFFHLVLERKNEEDIKKFIEIAMYKVQDAYLAERFKLTAEFEDMATYATANLMSRARGVFMWVEIVTRELERAVRRGVSPRKFKEIVDKLPNELEPFYERIVQDLMARFKRQRPKEAKSRLREAQRMLTWVTFAERPLHIREFRDAVATPELVGESSFINLQDDRVDDIAVRQRMSYNCGDLLEIGSSQDSVDFSLAHITNDIVQLLHLTVREFLTSDPRAGKFLMKKNLGEYEIFLNCISYLRLFTENCPATNGNGPNYKEMVCYLANWPLLSYILEFLPQHMRNSDNRDQISNVISKFADFILHQEGSSAFLILEAWLHKAGLCTHSHSASEPATSFRFDCMDIAAAEGSMNVVTTLLEAETAATTDDKYGNLLYNASRRGIYSLTRLLLQKGVDPSSTGEDGNTALQAASAHGHRVTLQLLADYGADVNAQGVNGSALYAAVKNGSVDIVELLLRAGADVNAQEANGSALYAAAENGFQEIVEILLKFRADVNAQEVNGSALYAALKNGSVDIVKLLLDHGADVNAQGSG
ncbi:kinesin [Trichoderma gamsii]|uniref:Kinesin n=1 Tax=Trichoderma gamsii TaxID=398673 RepID=A0A2P4ZBK6_9HYPO|nr:kinesin [Trichoderma gamsii]PON21684.1 kinesin [Trichoderma gamsii]